MPGDFDLVKERTDIVALIGEQAARREAQVAIDERGCHLRHAASPRGPGARGSAANGRSRPGRAPR